MQIGDWYLCGRNQEVVFISQAEEIFFKLRKLTGSDHGWTIDHERGDDFSIAMLGCVQIEHIVDQCSLQPGSGPGHDGKSGSSDFCGPVEIQDAEVFSDFPMGFGGTRKSRDGTPSTDLNIVGCISTHRDRRMWKIGDAQGHVGERFLYLAECSLNILNAIPQMLHRCHGFFSRFFGPAQSSHLFRALIEFESELLDL